MACICYAYLELVASWRQVGKICVLKGVYPYPVLVKAFQHIGIADLLEIAVVKGGEGDVEGVLVVADCNFRF